MVVVACRPVLNVTAKSSGSTSIAVSWLLVAPHPSCGDLVGFRVIYTQISARRRRSLDQADMQETFGEYSGNIREIFVNATVRSVKLLKLSKYAKHCVQVKVVLDPGRGDRPSPCLYVWTDEDGEWNRLVLQKSGVIGIRGEHLLKYSWFTRFTLWRGGGGGGGGDEKKEDGEEEGEGSMRVRWKGEGGY